MKDLVVDRSIGRATDRCTVCEFVLCSTCAFRERQGCVRAWQRKHEATGEDNRVTASWHVCGHALRIVCWILWEREIARGSLGVRGWSLPVERGPRGKWVEKLLWYAAAAGLESTVRITYDFLLFLFSLTPSFLAARQACHLQSSTNCEQNSCASVRSVLDSTRNDITLLIVTLVDYFGDPFLVAFFNSKKELLHICGLPGDHAHAFLIPTRLGISWTRNQGALNPPLCFFLNT